MEIRSWRRKSGGGSSPLRWLWLAIGLSLGPVPALALDSGSNGEDGNLVIGPCAAPGQTITWDPVGLDTDLDNVFHFGSITIQQFCTLKLTAAKVGQDPVIWLAQGPVVIDGTIDLSGENGHGREIGSLRKLSIPGPGGFAGGAGHVYGTSLGATNGFGPGGGRAGCGSDLSVAASGASHVTSINTNPPIPAYGNNFLLPLIGGSGGGGGIGVGSSDCGGGGGAGGGALLIASGSQQGSQQIPGRIQLSGAIRAKGGDGSTTDFPRNGGGGSGGAIRLVADVVAGTGTIDIRGGSGANNNPGSAGRARIEAPDFGSLHVTLQDNAGELTVATLSPSTRIADQILVRPPTISIESVTYTPSAGGGAVTVPVPVKPTGEFRPADVLSPADVPIDTNGDVTLAIKGNGVPSNATVVVEVHHEMFGTEPLAVSFDQGISRWLAVGTIRPGFAMVTARASFTP